MNQYGRALTVDLIQMISIGNPYFQYPLVIQCIAQIAAEMKNKRLKLHPKNFKLYREDNNGIKSYISTEVSQDMRAIYGMPKIIGNCEYCNGYGMWPGDEVAMTQEEITWQLGDECSYCGSNNHMEYLNRGRDEDTILPVFDDVNDEAKSIGFHAALEKFNRSILCAVSSDTQDQKILPV